MELWSLLNVEDNGTKWWLHFSINSWWKTELKKIHVPQHSLQHYLWYVGHGSNPERSPLAGEEIKKLQYIFTMEYCCSVVQSLSHVQLLTTSWTATHQASLSITISQSLLKFMSIESVMPSSHLILCHPLLCLLSIFLSIRAFSNKSDLCIRKPKYWIFSFSISPSNEYTGLISYRID